MQNLVFVLDTTKQPLSPCHPAVARKLLRDGKAAVYRRFPFTVILKRAVEKPEVEPIQLKVDPGSKTTGIALVQKGKVIFAAELEHRGQQIKDVLEGRQAIRRSRRQRKIRYRKPRFQNRIRPKGWLAPSLKSRVDNIQTWLVRFIKLCYIQTISMELIRFDTQLMQDAELSGIEYQQGELQGYEVREYVLEKFSRKCCYCGRIGCQLEIEHIIPKSRGGSRVSNLCLACRSCNEKKGNQTATEFGYPNVQALAKQPLKDASAVNSGRWAIWRMFDATGLELEVGTGGRTKFNRTTQNYPKAHWIDAACVGKSGQSVKLFAEQNPLRIKAVGRQNRQMCRMDKYGFPRTSSKQSRFVKGGFQTGDIVKAVVPNGKYAGVHIGAVAVRATGNFRVGKVDGISWKHCKRLHALDGYTYDN